MGTFPEDIRTDDSHTTVTRTNKNVKKMYTKILHDPIKFSSNVAVSDQAKDFIRKLLERNYSNRLGSSATGPQDVLNHPCFASLDMNQVQQI